MINTYLNELFKKKPEKITNINIKGKIALGNEEHVKFSDTQAIAFEINKQPFSTRISGEKLNVFYVLAQTNKGVYRNGIEGLKIGEAFDFEDSDYGSDSYNETIDTYSARDDMVGGTYIAKGTYKVRKSRLPLNNHKILDVILKISLIKGIFRIKMHNGFGTITRMK